MTYKPNSRVRDLSAALSTLVLLSSPLAFSAGFEKPNFFSAKWSGVGGAAASSVSGAEALFFNPAGLAAGDSTLEATGNFAPTFVQFSGPVGGTTRDSTNAFVPSFGAFVNYKVMPKWGIGGGIYLAGGSRSIFKDVDFTSVSGVAQPAFAESDATVQANVSVVEASLGTGYELLDGLRLGLSWRMAIVSGHFSSYGYDASKNAFSTLAIDNLSATSYNGFKVGLQYYPKDSRWGAGALWRTNVNFVASGDMSGRATFGTTIPGVVTSGQRFEYAHTKGSISSSLPQQVDLGGHYDILANGLRMYLQYTFTNYSHNKDLAIAGDTTFTLPVLGVQTVRPSKSELGWNNEHLVRVGFDCFEVQNWVFRAGYVWGSQVTPKDRARATLVAPGPGHTFALGAGTKFLNNSLETNLSLEYAFANVDTTGSGVVPPTSRDSGIPGKYTASDYAAMLGVTYRL